MLTRGEDVEAHALQKRGWSISAIARHLDRDRKTVRSYLNGDRVPGTRVRPDTPDPLAEYEKYLTARFTDDHHVWGTVLFEEVTALGYSQSYPTFVRQIRTKGLRPHCEACRGVVGRDTIEIDHPPGEEIQWDWFERRRAPWGGTAYVLLGTLPCSSRTRGGAGRVDGPGPPDRGHGRRAAPPRRDGRNLADRPAGHGHPAGHERRPGHLRPGGQALRGHRRAVPSPTGQPQRGRRGRSAVHVGPVVAHTQRRQS